MCCGLFLIIGSQAFSRNHTGAVAVREENQKRNTFITIFYRVTRDSNFDLFLTAVPSVHSTVFEGFGGSKGTPREYSLDLTKTLRLEGSCLAFLPRTEEKLVFLRAWGKETERAEMLN